MNLKHDLFALLRTYSERSKVAGNLTKVVRSVGERHADLYPVVVFDSEQAAMEFRKVLFACIVGDPKDAFQDYCFVDVGQVAS